MKAKDFMNCVCPCHADKSHDEKPCKCCRGNVYTCETLLLKEERDEARRLLEKLHSDYDAYVEASKEEVERLKVELDATKLKTLDEIMEKTKALARETSANLQVESFRPVVEAALALYQVERVQGDIEGAQEFEEYLLKAVDEYKTKKPTDRLKGTAPRCAACGAVAYLVYPGVTENRVGVKIDLRDCTDEERAALPPFKISDSSVLFVDSGSGDIGPPGPVDPEHRLEIRDVEKRLEPSAPVKWSQTWEHRETCKGYYAPPLNGMVNCSCGASFPDEL